MSSNTDNETPRTGSAEPVEQTDYTAKANEYFEKAQNYFFSTFTPEKINCIKDKTIEFANPCEDFYEPNHRYKGQRMDRFGYLSHKITEWKAENVLEKPVLMRAPVVLFATFVTFRCIISLFNPFIVSRGVFNKIVFPSTVFFGSSLFFTPEVINPYYTFYWMKYRTGIEHKQYSSYSDRVMCGLRSAKKSLKIHAYDLYDHLSTPSPQAIKEEIIEAVEEKQEVVKEIVLTGKELLEKMSEILKEKIEKTTAGKKEKEGGDSVTE